MSDKTTHSGEFEKLLSIKGLPGYIKAASLPNIDLYMDQVTTFFDEHLQAAKRYPDDKILTKTMINNYTKNKLLPPSDKKKYSQGHLILLIFIYYLKNILSINDIQTLLEPMIETHFSGENEMNMRDIYRGIVRLETGILRPFLNDISSKIDLAEKTFPEAEGEDRDYLKVFAMVSMLSFDVYLKKQMIERLIDDMRAGVMPLGSGEKDGGESGAKDADDEGADGKSAAETAKTDHPSVDRTSADNTKTDRAPGDRAAADNRPKSSRGKNPPT